MRRPTRTCSIIGIACALAASGAGRAAAQEDAAADTAAARKLGWEGLKLADAGNCPEAIDKLSRSEAMHHAVSVLERLGECQVRVGKLVAGIEALRRVLREPLAPDAPAPFVAAQQRAQQVLAEAKPRVARLKVAVAAPASAAIWVTIDGVNEPIANLNSDRFVDPGDHVVAAGAPGFRESKATVHLGEGGADSVALTLEVDPNAAATPPQPSAGATPATPSPASAPPAQSNHTAAWIAGGVGVVGLGFGVAFGLGAMGEKNTLDSACTGNVCPASQRGTADTGARLGTISTVGFIVGGVGLATGAALFFLDVGGSSSESSGPRASAYVGPGSAGVVGAF
jgi:hypothetical protein